MFSNIDFITVRKAKHDTHGKPVEITGGLSREIYRYIILDDCVASGNTVNKIKDALRGATCSAIVTYDRLTDYYPSMELTSEEHWASKCR